MQRSSPIFDLGGWIVNRLFVERDVKQIFAFRAAKLTELFGSEAGGLVVRSSNKAEVGADGTS
ncbi:MAG: hypothetical protein QOI53_1276 [Verrucomicrobiota bacterium]|nr:hypothetical protein [Verrucomicrobiota bacterium]